MQGLICFIGFLNFRKVYPANVFFMKAIFTKIFIILTILLSLSGCSGRKSTHGNIYYISPSGDDSSPGTRIQPWKTAGRTDSLDLEPGDMLLFEGGKTFRGFLHLDSLDSGSPGNKVTISSYGEGRAIIDGGNNEGIKVEKCSYFDISDLEVKGNGRQDGNTSDGILLLNSGNFEIKDIEVYGFQHSGLHIHISTDATIKKVYAHDNGFAGIHVTGTTIYDTMNYDNRNLYIGYSIAENNPGDPTVLNNHSGNGILASSVKNGLIEYCEAFNNGWDMPWTGNGPVGIWIWDCSDFIIQYCISHDNKTNPKAADGGGFDLDGGVSGSIIQYCISFNNQGSGYGLFEFGAGKPWENNIVRYNISQNDGIINGGSAGIWKNETAGTMRNCEIYNNTFFNNTERGVSLWVYNNWPGFNFRNNIFIYRQSFLDQGQRLDNEIFLANCYWCLSGKKEIDGFENLAEWAKATGNELIGASLAGIYADPQLTRPGMLILTDPARIDMDNLKYFYPEPGSPVIDRGIDIREFSGRFMVDKDIIGSQLPRGSKYDIGAMEYRIN
jgi:hypothetical protein